MSSAIHSAKSSALMHAELSRAMGIPFTAAGAPAASLDDYDIDGNPVTAAAAPTTAAAAAAATIESRAVDTALAAEMGRAERTLATDADTLSGHLIYSFAFQHGKQDAPAPVKFTKEALSLAFGGRVDFSKDVHIHSIELTGYSNSSPFPLSFTITGPKGEPVLHEIKASGEGITKKLHASTTSDAHHLVFAARDLDLKDIREHGNTTLDGEYSAITPLTDVTGNCTHVLVDTASNLGMLCKANEALVSETGVLEVVPGLAVSRYPVRKDRALKMLALYNKNKLSVIQGTRMTEHTATLARFDRSPSASERLAFSDPSDAPGLSRAQREAAQSTNHLVTVTAHIRLIDPAKLR